jgi:hypothetical protein
MNHSQSAGANQIELDGDHDARRPDWIARGQRAIDASVDADDNDRETHLVDVLCVLRHWAEDTGVDFESADRQAAWHYAHERLRSRDPESLSPAEAPWKFDPEQQRRTIKVIEGIPWGDMERQILCVEDALRLALQATAVGLLRWEHEAEGEQRFGDEFNLSREQVRDLDADWRLAYVGRLIYNMALCYGLSTDLANEAPLVTGDQHTPGALLRDLDDIWNMRLDSPGE